MPFVKYKIYGKHFHFSLNIHRKCYVTCELSSGVINGTAPNPVRLGEMCDHLGKVMGRPSWLPVPDFALKAVLGEGASVVRLLHLV